MIHLIAGVVLTVLLLYVAALYESTALVFLAFLLAGLTLGAAVLLVWRIRSLEIGFAIPMTLAESGHPVGARFSLRARRRLFGKTRIRVRVDGRQLPGKRIKRTWMWLDAPDYGEETVRQEVTMYCAGGYEYRLQRMRVYDWTGWFYLTKRLNQSQVTQLLPNVQELQVQLSGAVKNFFGEAEVFDDLRGGTDHSEVFQIREYAPGDRLQNIHWKLSAKSDDLMVREYSLPKGCPIVLLLGTDGADRLKPAQRNRFLQIAASVSFALMDAQCPHIVSWYDGARDAPVRMRVDDEEGFYEWQLTYLMSDAVHAGVDVEARYQEKYQNEVYLHRLRVEPRLELYLDGKLWHTFSKKGSLKDEMGTLQLYL